MLDFLQPTQGQLNLYRPLQTIGESPFPQTPEELWQLEQQLYSVAGWVADHILSLHLQKAHEDKVFVKQAVNQARGASQNPLVHKGWKEVSVLFLGGSRVVFKTPYLREILQRKPIRKRRKRGKEGSGVYPVLEALGIRDGVSPATRSEIALHTVQAASYQEAIQLLARKGLVCDPSTLARIAVTTAQADISLRDASLSAAMSIPVSSGGPLAGKRVRVSLDGGRVRTRKNRKGRKNHKGRHGFTTPWREPRVLVIDLLDEQGKPDPLRLPLYDALLDDADATFNLLVGYLRLLGVAHATIVEFIADGADWIWDRIDRLIVQAEIPESILVQVVDFYHASEHLSEAMELCKELPKKKRQKLYEKLRHILRHEPKGIERVIQQLREQGGAKRGKEMEKALIYFEKHITRMNYATLDEMKLPVGSGQVESAVRRVVNLRFKAPGSFWKEDTVSGLMHLRAYFKAGRWNELMKRVLTKEFHIPSFDPIQKKASLTLRASSKPQSPLETDLEKAA